MSDTLSHHGIKGQRWGIRRYQNLDGTLTIAGKKHAASQGTSSKVSKPTKSKTKMEVKGKPKSTESSKPKTKTLSEMTDAELKAAIDRRRLETSYLELNPQKVSKGKDFMSKVGSKFMDKSADAVADLGAQALKSALAKGGNKVLGKLLEDDFEKIYANNQKKK